MDISISEFMELQKNHSDTVVEMQLLKYEIEMKSAIKEKDAEISRLKEELQKKDEALATAEAENKRLHGLIDSKDYENELLKTCLILSREKVRNFFRHIANMEIFAVIYAFLMKAFPESSSMSQKEIIDQIATFQDTPMEVMRELGNKIEMAASRPTTNVQGDLVGSKEVQNEVNGVAEGGTGIEINK